MRQQRQQGIIWVAALKVAYVGGTQPCSRHVLFRRALLEEGFAAGLASAVSTYTHKHAAGQLLGRTVLKV
jgi:hypothetical protein